MVLALTALAFVLGQEPPPAPAEPVFKTLARQVTVGGQVRLRAEYRDPFSYNPAVPGASDDDDLYLSRVRLHLKFTLSDEIEVFFQPQDQRVFGDEASVLSDEQNLDVHQGYVDVRLPIGAPVTLRAGRQELSYGDQRLVSPLDWSNIAGAWDGIKARYSLDGAWVEGFWTVIKEGIGAEDDQDFYGLYASWAAIADHEFDLYVFGRRLNDNLQPAETGGLHDRRDATGGVRAKGKAAGFDYTVEGMIQRGDVGPDDVRSWAAAATLGYTFDLPWKPRIGVEYTHASGDADPADGRIETFDPLYPFGHFYQGFADVFSFKNGRDIAFYLKAVPVDSLSVHVDLHFFRLDEERDAWYNFAGARIRRDVTGSAGKDVGREVDLHARLAVGKFVKFWGGASRFFAGDFVRDTPGTDRDMMWAFLQMTVDF
jgi:hypothetical protein